MHMPNNLDKKIAESGMSKKEVAAAKGITPETLSRHVHGKIQMTLADAEQYGNILGCTAQDVLFATEPLPIVARWVMGEDSNPYLEQAADNSVVYLSAYHDPNTACIQAQLGQDAPWHFEMWDGQLEVIDYTPALEGRVSKECFQYPSYAMTEAGKLWWGLVYPEPGGTYTIHANTAPGFNNATGVKLKWACPVISIIRRPDLRGAQVVNAK